MVGFFPQWYPCTFFVDGIEYNCAEQFMMAEKARFFDDGKSLQRILAATYPKDQKALGRKVKNFNKEDWEIVAKDIVFDGNVFKFSQNPELLSHLLETGNKTLVEASPTDCIWGIGLGMNDDLRFDESQWRGINRLGEVLMKVRDYFVKKDRFRQLISELMEAEEGFLYVGMGKFVCIIQVLLFMFRMRVEGFKVRLKMPKMLSRNF